MAIRAEAPEFRTSSNGTPIEDLPKAKLAELVATRIETEIIDRGWPVGEVLGSETDLIEKYGVSRAVFREAVRIVEHHQVARMRRGPGGGLVVTVPELTSMLRPALLYLAHANARVGDLWGLRRAVELETVRLAADRLDEAGIQRLRDVVQRERGSLTEDHNPRVNRGFHIVLAELTENPAIILFTGLLMNLAYTGEASSRTPEQLKLLAVDTQQHIDIVEALVAGDTALAQHRMRAHLDYVEGLLESEYPALPYPPELREP